MTYTDIPDLKATASASVTLAGNLALIYLSVSLTFPPKSVY